MEAFNKIIMNPISYKYISGMFLLASFYIFGHWFQGGYDTHEWLYYK